MSGPYCTEHELLDRPVKGVFREVFSKVPVLGAIWDSEGFTQDKTGLFGAVWIDERKRGVG